MKQIIVDNISTNYYITEEGKCYNNRTNKFLKGQISKNGYMTYMITLPKGNKRRLYAHRLVANAFIANDDKNKTQINHLDGNKLNNNINNLVWCTAEENQKHVLETGLRKYNTIFCFNKNKELVAKYLNISDAAKAVGCSKSIILQEVNKDIKTLSYGFYWSKEKELGKTKDYANLGKAKEVYQYDLNGKYIMKYESTGQAARALGLKKSSHISECCRGKIPSYRNFIWRYAEDIVSTSNEN